MKREKKKISRFWLVYSLYSIGLFILAARGAFLDQKLRKVSRPDLVGTYDPGRLAPWYEYAETLRFYTVPSSDRRPRICSYVRGFFAPSTQSSVYIYPESFPSEDIWSLCIAHEVGHHIDAELDWISQMDVFERAVELSIKLWEDLPEGAYHWRAWGEFIAAYPGVNGNPLVDIEGRLLNWGGFGELYADLHEIDYLIQIPPPLQKFYKDFVPWIWYGGEDG